MINHSYLRGKGNIMQNIYTKQDSLETGKNKSDGFSSSLGKEENQKIKDTVSDVKKKLAQGEEQLKEIVSTIDKQLHENPWPIVGGVAAGCLLLGFIMGKSK